MKVYDPAHAAKLKEMQNLLLAEMRRLEDPWRLWNQPDDGLTPPLAPPRRCHGNPKPKEPNRVDFPHPQSLKQNHNANIHRVVDLTERFS